MTCVKNDAGDAETIATAVRQHGKRFAKPKNLDLQSAVIHSKTEQKLVQTRARLTSSIRSMLAEISLITSHCCMVLLDLVDGLAEYPGDVPEDAQMAIYATK